MRIVIENQTLKNEKPGDDNEGMLSIAWDRGNGGINPCIFVRTDEWTVYVNSDGSLTLEK